MTAEYVVHQRRGRDGDVKVDDRLSDGAAVGGDGGNRILAGVGCANIAEAASHADGGDAVRRGRKGVPLPPGMNSWFFGKRFLALRLRTRHTTAVYWF